MPKPVDENGFTSHVLDLLVGWGDVRARRMFGGEGLFIHGLMFALIFEDVLYLKDSIDGRSEPTQVTFDKEYFEYTRLGKTVYLRFFKAPEQALEDSSFLVELANASYQSAFLKKKSIKSKPPSKGRPKTVAKVLPKRRT